MSDKESLAFSHILASCVHDMKNSLSMLINTLDDVTDSLQPSDAGAAGQLTQLKYETKRVNSQLVQLLTLFKLNNSQYYLNVAEIDMSEFAEEVLIPHRELLQQKGITIEAEVQPDLVWYFDGNLVSGVINNVLNNAFKYTKDRIRFSVTSEDDWLVLAIADNGPGYPEDMLMQGVAQQTGINADTGSTGLGLYFSKEVAEFHKHRDRAGHIVLDNGGIDGGGRFRLFLP